MQRLDKLIADNSVYSRSEVKSLVRGACVMVDGAVIRDSGAKIDDGAEIRINGRVLECRRFRYVILNKPCGVVTALTDSREKTVMSLIPPELSYKGLAPVGRLDKDTSGLLLLTNDGELAHKIISPASEVMKYYVAGLEKPYLGKYAERFANGSIILDGSPCLPASVAPFPNDQKKVLIAVREGRFHQVRRMLRAVENNALTLSRIRIGEFNLPKNLGNGEALEILHKDVELMLKTPQSESFEEVCFCVFSSL